MKIAYVHVLPLEYYPPATNALALFATKPDWEIRTWTSPNARGLPEWRHDGVSISRIDHGNREDGFLLRAAGYARWHMEVATALHRWKPDTIIAVEPHSLPAVWLYYKTFGSAALFIHFHEYYSPEDYEEPGMRLLRMGRRMGGDTLLERAFWISQTNSSRLRMMLADHPRIHPDAARVLANYPPAEWTLRAGKERERRASTRTRLLYLGSASLDDTFIAEIARWVEERSDEYSLHVVGENIAPDVWRFLDSLNAPTITTERSGFPYPDLPELLASFDVGLVLYKCNTLNFVYNVPNKAIEYLAGGLEVWFPPEMKGMQHFRKSHPGQRLREVDFKSLETFDCGPVRRKQVQEFPFTNEAALAPLLAQLDRIASEAA